MPPLEKIVRWQISQNFFPRGKISWSVCSRQIFWTYKNFVGATTLSSWGSYVTWTNFSWQDESWAEFSTLEVTACNAKHLLSSIAIRPNLELKTLPKQLLGSLLLDVVLPGDTMQKWQQHKRHSAQQCWVIMLSVVFYLPSCYMSLCRASLCWVSYGPPVCITRFTSDKKVTPVWWPLF
jgi:hypothetical protein